MFRALTCPSSGGPIVFSQYLVSSLSVNGCTVHRLRVDSVRQYSHATSERGLSSITIADAHTSAASSRLNWRPRRFKWTRPFRRKTKSGFCACAITFQTQSTNCWTIIELCIMPSKCIRLICMNLTTNTNYLPVLHWWVLFSGHTPGFLWGRNLSFIY